MKFVVLALALFLCCMYTVQAASIGESIGTSDGSDVHVKEDLEPAETAYRGRGYGGGYGGYGGGYRGYGGGRGGYGGGYGGYGGYGRRHG